jgi:ureidoacrylate peracid hydrolase
MLKAAVQPCRRLIEGARAAGVPVIYTRYIFRADYADGGVMVKYLLPALGESGHLTAGTQDIEIVGALAPLQGDYVVDKNRPSSFYATGLEPILNGLDVDSLVVCGVTTNCCVETTVRDASQRDYKTFVVTDATGELEQERHDFAINTMAFLFADAVTVDDMIQIWQSKQSSAA